MPSISYHQIAQRERGGKRQRCGYTGFWMRIMMWATRHCARG